MAGLEILTGDCREVLPTLEAGSVQTCCTSPPYWGLRDYGTAQWEGGEVGCEHVGPPMRTNNKPSDQFATFHGGTSRANEFYKNSCGKCGARRIDSQLGLEATPQEYIANMVAVFREVWRVLRNDGTLWMNLGDSYCASPGQRKSTDEAGEKQQTNGGSIKVGSHSVPGLKPKDLCMMPARLAMALQADGWYLRSDIIWHKPNPMPESVTDRPTKAHEYIFLLTKQERYFYDSDAIRETWQQDSILRDQRGYNGTFMGRTRIADPRDKRENGLDGKLGDYSGRNKRSVWTIATQPYPEAHFATFPEEIPKLCILAGSKPGDVILDPFAGSGTVGQVALELGRRAVLIELNPDYIELATDRTFVTPGFL